LRKTKKILIKYPGPTWYCKLLGKNFLSLVKVFCGTGNFDRHNISQQAGHLALTSMAAILHTPLPLWHMSFCVVFVIIFSTNLLQESHWTSLVIVSQTMHFFASGNDVGLTDGVDWSIQLAPSVWPELNDSNFNVDGFRMLILGLSSGPELAEAFLPSKRVDFEEFLLK